MKNKLPDLYAVRNAEGVLMVLHKGVPIHRVPEKDEEAILSLFMELGGMSSSLYREIEEKLYNSIYLLSMPDPMKEVV